MQERRVIKWLENEDIMGNSESRSRLQVVGVMSSARLNGNTAILVREALKGAKEEGALITNAIIKNLLDRLGLFERFTSATFGGKYVVGISTARSAGAAKKVAKGLAGLLTDGVFERGYVTGFLGASSGANGVENDSDALRRACALGRKLARDIRSGKGYPLQNPAGRLLIRFILKPSYSKAILDYREGPVKGVYQNLWQRGMLPQL
jgi:hypothetical protein